MYRTEIQEMATNNVKIVIFSCGLCQAGITHLGTSNGKMTTKS